MSYSDAFPSTLLDANDSAAKKGQQRQISDASMLPANDHKKQKQMETFIWFVLTI